MQALRDMDIGLMFWAGESDPAKNIRNVKSLGIPSGHLGFAGHVQLDGAAERWKRAAEQEQFAVTTVFSAYDGESYADIPTVQNTVGFIPRATREAREARTRQVIDVAAGMGVPSFACHIGFVPEDHSDADYMSVRDIVRRICDYAAKYNMTFALETGQEPADVLLRFMRDVGRGNLKINFDPANLILYGTGDPIDALGVLGSQVVSIHVKDGNWPPKDKPGALGTEMPLGQGAVGMERFIAKLKAIGYRGPLTIEREVALDQDMDDRHQEGFGHAQDVRNGVELLKRLRG